MEGRMANRCQLIEAYALQTDFEISSRLDHAVHVHQCRQRRIHTARYLHLVPVLILSTLPKPGAIQSQQQEDKTRSVD